LLVEAGLQRVVEPEGVLDRSEWIDVFVREGQLHDPALSVVTLTLMAETKWPTSKLQEPSIALLEALGSLKLLRSQSRRQDR
jgi:hypothetical protein